MRFTGRHGNQIILFMTSSYVFDLPHSSKHFTPCSRLTTSTSKFEMRKLKSVKVGCEKRVRGPKNKYGITRPFVLANQNFLLMSSVHQRSKAPRFRLCIECPLCHSVQTPVSGGHYRHGLYGVLVFPAWERC
jgi:hypothetical protein